jgi:hypothetical protein
MPAYPRMRSSDSANTMYVTMRAPSDRYSGSRKKAAAAVSHGSHSVHRMPESATNPILVTLASRRAPPAATGAGRS